MATGSGNDFEAADAQDPQRIVAGYVDALPTGPRSSWVGTAA